MEVLGVSYEPTSQFAYSLFVSAFVSESAVQFQEICGINFIGTNEPF